jgi:hypothetical protein
MPITARDVDLNSYHRSRGGNGKPDSVFIYNVSNKLIQKRGNDFIVGFRYPESSNGYANFCVSQDELVKSENSNFCHVIMKKTDSRRLNYKIDGADTAKMVTPSEIKRAFEAVRPSNSKSARSTERERTSDENSRSRESYLDGFDNPVPWTDEAYDSYVQSVENDIPF